MTPETQALCFLAGANSIFYGEKLLTTPNPGNRCGPGAFRPIGPEPDAAASRPRLRSPKDLILGMRHFLSHGILCGALVLAPAISFIGLDPYPRRFHHLSGQSPPCRCP